MTRANDMTCALARVDGLVFFYKGGLFLIVIFRKGFK